MQNTKTYNLTKTQQLIDLNGDTTNFDLTFTATSKNGHQFDLLVVDQTTLDTNPSLEFKKVVNGTMSGNIVSDKGIYQNYFLILKSDNPCECTVQIDKKEIKMKEKEERSSAEEIIPFKSPQTQLKSSKTNWKKIIIWGLIILLIAAVLYYL